MTEYEFETGDDSNLVIVECYVNGYELRFIIDTGASDTIMDKNALIAFEGELLRDHVPITLETASGSVVAETALVNSFEALGVRLANHRIHVYDFLQQKVFTEIDGVLGLDFFVGRKLCIDFRQLTIALT